VQVLAAFVDGAVVGAAQQHQVAQVGGAAMQPMPQMVGLAPGRVTVSLPPSDLPKHGPASTESNVKLGRAKIGPAVEHTF
jgi:hypothetical protein